MAVEVLPAPRALVDLVRVVRDEHEAVERALGDAVAHATSAGEALLEAQAQVPRGGWTRWLEDNFEMSRHTAEVYIRIARHRDLLPPGMRSRNQAIAYLRSHKDAADGRRHGAWGHPVEVREEAAALHATGLSYAAVGRALGVATQTVQGWLSASGRREQDQRAKNRARRQRERERRRAQDALRREDRDRAVKKIGGGVAEAYAQLRRTAQTVDRLRDATEERDVRVALGHALTNLHLAEDKIVVALGVDDPMVRTGERRDGAL